MPRPKNTDRRREEIVAGMLRAMATHGYERATIAQIAREAGLTGGLVHYHFSSKQEILIELVHSLSRRLNERFQSMAEGGSPAQRLGAFIDSRLATGSGADAEAVACWVAIGAEALRQPEVSQVYRAVMVTQRNQLQELVAVLAPEIDSDEAAAAILAAIEGCYQLAAAIPEIAPPGFASRSVRRMAAGLLNGSRLTESP